MPKKKAAQEPMDNVVRDFSGLRDALVDEIDALRNGTSNPARANAVAKLAKTKIDELKDRVKDM